MVIDEAHVFIDTKFPVALDFMFQLAKRIRKYNGMQIVITQNIKDFVGSEEIARKSTAIINACQYSFIFALAPNDIQDLCKLYEKAGGINEVEQEQITTAPRGQAFTIMSPSSRSTFKVTVPENVVSMFQDQDYQSRYFSGPNGAQLWEETVGESREKYLEKKLERWGEEEETEQVPQVRHRVTFVETDEEEEAAARPVVTVQEEPALAKTAVTIQEETASEAPAAQASAASVQEASAAPSSMTEQLLAQLLGKFSYDAMLQEIRRTVRAEMERERAESGVTSPVTGAVEVPPAAAPAPVVQTPVPEPIPEPAPEPVEPLETRSEEPVPEAIPESEPAPVFAGASASEEKAEEELAEFPALSELLGSVQSEEELEQPDEDFTAYVEHPEPVAETEQETTEPPESGETEAFDIMSLLAKQAEQMQNISPIDMMVAYDEQVIEITLEELVQYNQKQRARH